MGSKKTINGVFIGADVGKYYPVDLAADNVEVLLKSMQDKVGGCIEAVDLARSPDGRQALTMYVNEDGKGLCLALNLFATLIAYESGAIKMDDTIVGDVIIVGTDSAGNTIDVQAGVLLKIMQVVEVRMARVLDKIKKDEKHAARERDAAAARLN